MSRSIKKVTEALNQRLLRKEISFPDPTQYSNLKRGFMHSGFPGVIGAIDCTHVLIIAPPQPIEENYINRKGNHSINVQLVSMNICLNSFLKYKKLLRIFSSFPASLYF